MVAYFGDSPVTIFGDSPQPTWNDTQKYGFSMSNSYCACSGGQADLHLENQLLQAQFEWHQSPSLAVENQAVEPSPLILVG